MKIFTRTPKYNNSTVDKEGNVIEHGPYDYIERSPHWEAEAWEFMPETRLLESLLDKETREFLISKGFIFHGVEYPPSDLWKEVFSKQVRVWEVPAKDRMLYGIGAFVEETKLGELIKNKKI